MSDNKISVIMGIYNCEKTLDEAIQSILCQTYTNWELIMCDDGSKDGTYNIAEKYVKKYPEKFVLLRNEENKGLNYTLNKCLYVATGDYIARMDGDDISLPTRFEREVEFLTKNPEYTLVSTPMIMFDEDGDWGKTTAIQYPTINDFCVHSPFFSHAACMIKKQAFLEVEGYTVDKKLLRVEDCHLWFKIYAKGYKGANLMEALYKMRDDKNAFKRRSFKSRLNVCYVQYIGFKLLKMPWYKYVYVIRYTVLELVKGIIPLSVYEFIHKRKYNRSK